MQWPNETAVRGQRHRVAAGLIAAVALTLAATLAVDAYGADDAISVANAWSRATPSGAKVAIGFATIKNNSDEADKLVSAMTEVAGQTQIHKMAMEGGVMKMREVTDGLPVPANGEVVLKPGSYHLMLMDLKQALKEGDHFSGTLTFEKAGAITVVFEVKGIGAAEPSDPHQGH
jgi:copper(I)-binding protein